MGKEDRQLSFEAVVKDLVLRILTACVGNSLEYSGLDFHREICYREKKYVFWVFDDYWSYEHEWDSPENV